jgi:hypothetical protein
MQGVHAFAASGGLGIGAGSFRSSSILTAILGSGGVIAVVAFVMYVARVFRPLDRRTWRPAGEPMVDVARAAGWAALAMLIPASVSAPSPDPGLLWGLITGTALGLRRAALLTRAEAVQRRRAARAIGSISAASDRAGTQRSPYPEAAAQPALVLGNQG